MEKFLNFVYAKTNVLLLVQPRFLGRGLGVAGAISLNSADRQKGLHI
jgi:hypothetical protein